MKRPLIAVLVLFVLLAGTLAAWTWLAPSRSTPAPRVAVGAEKHSDEKPTFEVKPRLRPATTVETREATRSIRAQLDAFRRDDYQSAARYQSQSLRGNFPSVKNFQNMIERSYPQFADYQSVTFGKATAQQIGKDIIVVVPIQIIGQDGVKVQATYNMVKENGIYCIGGVSGGAAPSEKSDDQKPQVPSGFEGVAPLIT